MRPSDPTPQIEVIDEQTAAMYRAMTPEQRVRLGLGMHAFFVRAMEAGVRHTHPDWSDAQVRAEVVKRVTRAAG